MNFGKSFSNTHSKPVRRAQNGDNGPRGPKMPIYTAQGDGPSKQPVSMPNVVLAATALQAWLASPSLAGKEIYDYVENLSELVWPILSNLGFSGIVGLVAAKALLMVGTALMFAVGVAFIFLQVLVYKGYITMNWTRVQDKMVYYLDRNRDKVVDKEDLEAVMQDGLGMLTQGVPSVGGFLAGFALGLRL